jgi:cell division protein ZapA
VDRDDPRARPFPCEKDDATVARMSGAPVELRVGGQTYRVVASANEQELRRLADIVDGKLRELTAPGRQISPQSLLLVALALAHDLEEERARRVSVERRWREKLTLMLQRIDAALDATTVVEERVAEAEAPSHDS